VIVYAVVDEALSCDSPLGDSLDVFICRADADRFIDEVKEDDPELASRSSHSLHGQVTNRGGSRLSARTL